MVDEEKMSDVLSEFAFTLGTNFPIKSILDHLVQRIVGVLPVTSAGVTLIEPGEGARFVAASDASALRYEQLQTELGEGPCLRAYDSGKAVVVPDLRNDDRFPLFGPAALESGLSAVFTFPLNYRDGRFGALDLYREDPGPLDADDLESAQTLANVAAAYLLNARSRDEAQHSSDKLRQLTLHDTLTGLPNRLLLEQRIEHADKRSRRSHAIAAVLFMDLDDFKSVNDNHGHRAGDQLLRAVAVRLSGLIRPGDTLARISGDEFVILCEDVRSPAAVESLGKRVTEACAEPFVLADATVRITASVGIAYAGPGDDITKDLVSQADAAMYQAKRRGASDQVVELRGDISGVIAWDGSPTKVPPD